MAKGKKTCPNCSVVIGCRTLVCVCGYEFKSAKKDKVDISPPLPEVNNADSNYVSVEEVHV